MKRRDFLWAVLAALLSAAPVAAAFDSSEYRRNTYGPPTHYCDPARPLNSNGSGTLADPWNQRQAMTLAAAGNVIGFLPGVGVRLPSTDNDNLPTFRPTNSGTASRRIVFVTKYAAVALPNVATNSNRTELRHDGTPAVAIRGQGDAGSGSPMYGAYQTNYVTFDGFYIDMAQAQPTEDGGVIRVENATGVHFRNFEIKGTKTNMGSNAAIYRSGNAVDTVLSNFRAYDFVNDPTNSATPQQGFFSLQYGDQNFLIEHFEITNVQHGPFAKGTAYGNFNYGIIRYGIVRNATECFRFNDLHPVNLTTVEHSLCYDLYEGVGAGLTLSSETTPARNFLMHHVTVARVAATSIETHGGVYGRRTFGPNVTIRDNIFDIDNGRFGHGIDFAEASTLPAEVNHNGFTKNGGRLSWAYNGVQHDSLDAWRAASRMDANSVVLSGKLFVDRANGNFRLVAGHPAMKASSTGGPLGAYASSISPGVDVPRAAPSK